MTTTTYTLVSALVGDWVPSAAAEISSPESPITWEDLPAPAREWATAHGYGADEAELLYVIPGRQDLPVGFATLVVEVEPRAPYTVEDLRAWLDRLASISNPATAPATHPARLWAINQVAKALAQALDQGTRAVNWAQFYAAALESHEQTILELTRRRTLAEHGSEAADRWVTGDLT